VGNGVIILQKIVLKGKCHEIFRLRFFYQTTSTGPNEHVQREFLIFSNIREEICFRN
jgi:hypothetical protein